MIKITDPDYPAPLKEIYNPPKTLYYKGDPKHLKKPAISVVGTRKYTDYGEYLTEKIIEDLSVLDISIVSGLAKGIDTIAHKCALKNNLPTIAVLGNGIDYIYPKENRDLSKEIIKNGLIISEYPGMTEPKKIHFPLRNRIISGLSLATIVIEAQEQSGALITAKLALEQGREIFTVPGDIDRETSLGPLSLIQRCGAYPISSGYDVIEVLKLQPSLFPKKKGKKQIDLSLRENEKLVLAQISKFRKTSLEQIQKKTSLTIVRILSTLSILEIKGLIKLIGGQYQRTI